MKKTLFKDSIREIKKTYKRFISILLMAFLGVGFFAGIKVSSPDMVDTIDKYYKEQNVYDIQVLSTLGLTNEDITEISKIDNVENVIATFETDGQIEIENKEVVAKVISLSDFNKPVLIDGRLPLEQNECVVEPNFLTSNNKKIGDTIELDIEDSQNDEGESIPYLYENKLTIVGTVRSPIYISRDRGTSNLGSGKIDYYLYILENNICANSIYTNIYVKVKDSCNYTTSTNKYEKHVESVRNAIEDIKASRETARYNSIVSTANKKVQDAEEELNAQKLDAEKQLDEAKKKIDDGKKQIETAEKELESNRKTADSEFSKAYIQITSAKKQLADSEKELNDKEQEANTKFEALEKQKSTLKQNLSELTDGLAEVQTSYDQLSDALKNPELSEVQKTELEKTKIQLEAQISTLNKNKKQIQDSITQIDSSISSGKQELETAKKQLSEEKIKLEKSEADYNKNKKSTYEKLDSAEKEIASSKEEIALGEEELAKSQTEFDEKIADAEKKLSDAKEKINDIENPKWYVLDRNSNSGYFSFIQDTESIANISKVFPVIFFVVAALISLTSMTRMVEEQRTQIGTLKALGYNKFQITSKYVIYATLACLVGGIAGMCLGFVLLPKIIWEMYGMMYQFNDAIQTSFNLTIGGLGLFFIIVSIVGATIYVIIKELIQTPATLMRPKAPKIGKRVLLEKCTFIWKHLNFSKKVTVRNIFRYKKRGLMTIIGIMGCTALIVTGFGIRDSIRHIMPDQYENIFSYDLQINLKTSLSENEKQNFISQINGNENVEYVAETYMSSSSAIKEEHEEDVQIIVPKENNGIDGVIHFKDIETKQSMELTDDTIFLTDKAAQLLGVKSGDTLTLKDSDNNEIQITISNVVENYIYHYVYMSKAMYEKLYNLSYSSNVLLVKDKTLSTEDEDIFVTDLMNTAEVASVTRISTAMNMMNDTMKSLNYVVVILIVSAGLLAFVVLYNLANVNISERIRELATIKVLGFYDKEVYMYVTRETVILTVIGILLGLVGGYFLDYFLMETCEINMLRFNKIVEPMSYVYAVLITILFTIIVNIVTYFALKKIDMIESLKSVE